MMKENIKKRIEPEIYTFLSYREFLSDWFSYQKSVDPTFRLAHMAKKCGMSLSKLSMIMTGSRDLTKAGVSQIASGLGLSRNEKNFLAALIVLNTSHSEVERGRAFKALNKIKSYQKKNPDQSVAFQYLNCWYYVAIREMSALPGFVCDVKWIQSRLVFPVSEKGIQNALKFLIEHQFIKLDDQLKVIGPGTAVDFVGPSYSLALAEFHREMFGLALQSITTLESKDRNILGYTLAVDEVGFTKIHELLTETQAKIKEIASGASLEKNKVVHVELALFPLSGKKEQSS